MTAAVVAAASRIFRDEESPNCGASKPRGMVLDNVKAEQSDGKCNRKIPPFDLLRRHGGRRGKSE